MWNTVFSVIKIPSLFQIFASFGENQIEIGVKGGWVVNLQSLKESRRLIKKTFRLLGISTILLNLLISH